MATTRTPALDALYKGRKGKVDFVEVPELGYLVVAGRGAPDGEEFAAAVQALFTVGYGAHFLVRKLRGDAPRVMPLEALWWVEGARQQDLVADVAAGGATMADTDRSLWRWRAMIMQPAPVDDATVAAAVDRAAAKNLPALGRLRFERWAEGLCAQTLHIGPYAAEAPTIVRLHDAIAARGYRPRGHHHEIYLGDPRRSAPETLRTLLRHPVER